MSVVYDRECYPHGLGLCYTCLSPSLVGTLPMISPILEECPTAHVIMLFSFVVCSSLLQYRILSYVLCSKQSHFEQGANVEIRSRFLYIVIISVA